jgi:glycosyltransferase involved in cell wall biosynthesis
MGRINPIKGPDLLLDAFFQVHQEFPNYHLVYAGRDQGLQEGLEVLCKERGIEKHVHFLGHLDVRLKSMAYHACSFLAIPSRSDAMSIVALEAGIVGKPILFTDQCGLQEFADNGIGVMTGTSAAELARGLRQMMGSLKTSPPNSQLVRDYVLDHFSWERIIEKYVGLFSSREQALE